MKQNKSFQKKMVPATLEDGTQILVDVNSIPKNSWDVHHGQTLSGSRVNSPKTYRIGKTTIIALENNSAALAMSNDDFEVLSSQCAAAFGYSVSAGNKIRPAAQA